jgi:hypothetical protein
LRWPRDTLYQLKLALTSPAGCGRSVGIVRLRTKTTEFSLFYWYVNIFWKVWYFKFYYFNILSIISRADLLYLSLLSSINECNIVYISSHNSTQVFIFLHYLKQKYISSMADLRDTSPKFYHVPCPSHGRVHVLGTLWIKIWISIRSSTTLTGLIVAFLSPSKQNL